MTTLAPLIFSGSPQQTAFLLLPALLDCFEKWISLIHIVRKIRQFTSHSKPEDHENIYQKKGEEQ
jgi:hypothetical protein